MIPGHKGRQELTARLDSRDRQGHKDQAALMVSMAQLGHKGQPGRKVIPGHKGRQEQMARPDHRDRQDPQFLLKGFKGIQ